jgi:hypothetical protein
MHDAFSGTPDPWIVKRRWSRGCHEGTAAYGAQSRSPLTSSERTVRSAGTHDSTRNVSSPLLVWRAHKND